MTTNAEPKEKFFSRFKGILKWLETLGSLMLIGLPGAGVLATGSRLFNLTKQQEVSFPSHLSIYPYTYHPSNY